MWRFLFVTVSLLFTVPAISQEQDSVWVYGVVVDGDTIPVISLKEARIYAYSRVLTAKEERQLTRLMKNVKIVYPYARMAGIKLLEYEDTLALAPDDQARRKIMKKVEEQLNAEYGDELRDLTVTQGKILLKLIDRETGETSYELVSELRGDFRAFFYQAFARLFGLNMKTGYDPDGEDQDIEYIVHLIETGQL
jgi:hypothetical protein